jgi:hypothetical protein
LHASVSKYQEVQVRLITQADLIQENSLELFGLAGIVSSRIEEVKEISQLCKHLLLLQAIIDCLNDLCLEIINRVKRILQNSFPKVI